MISRAIDRGLGFLTAEQNSDGSFWCLTSTRFDDYISRVVEAVPAIVPTNIVLSSLAHIGSGFADLDFVECIKNKAANFLLGEKSEHWAFNYWFRRTERYKTEPYPDDLDDTFCALAALYEYRPHIFDGAAMAKIVTMLTSAEKAPGGPYDMWLVPPEGRATWNDTDLVVNSNIAYFLSLQGITLPNVTKFIEDSIDAQDYEFPYNTIYPGIYFISRSYCGPKMKQMAELLLSKQQTDGRWENPLRTALAISSLINFYDHGLLNAELLSVSPDSLSDILSHAGEYLLREQSADGSWTASSFFFQMRKKERTLYAGSASISTALCLEALSKIERYRSMGKVIQISAADEAGDISEGKKIYDEIVSAVRQRFSRCSRDLKKLADGAIEKTLTNDTNRQIVLLPFFFRSSLGKAGKSISDAMIIRLGAANLFGWMAYTIYDDFLDGEGEPTLLPFANICLRELACIYRSFGDFATRILDSIDEANAWEVLHCRSSIAIPDFGDLSQLANKSLGHALGPVAILSALDYDEQSFEVQNTLAFFKHYLIARQLNDDAHDWADDLKRGCVNAVAARMLRGREVFDIEALRKVFWRETVVGVCADILMHVGRAKAVLAQLTLIDDKSYLFSLIAPIERSVEKALRERAEAMRFLHVYDQSSCAHI